MLDSKRTASEVSSVTNSNAAFTTPVLRRAQTACVSTMRSVAQHVNVQQQQCSAVGSHHHLHPLGPSTDVSCLSGTNNSTANGGPRSVSLAGTTSLGSTLAGAACSSTTNDSNAPFAGSQTASPTTTASAVPTLPPIAHSNHSSPNMGSGRLATSGAVGRTGSFRPSPPQQYTGGSGDLSSAMCGHAPRNSLPPGDLAQTLEHSYPPAARPTRTGSVLNGHYAGVVPLGGLPLCGGSRRVSPSQINVNASDTHPQQQPVPASYGSSPAPTPCSADHLPVQGQQGLTTFHTSGMLYPRNGSNNFGPYNVSAHNLDTFDATTRSGSSSSSSSSDSSDEGGTNGRRGLASTKKKPMPLKGVGMSRSDGPVTSSLGIGALPRVEGRASGQGMKSGAGAANGGGGFGNFTAFDSTAQHNSRSPKGGMRGTVTTPPPGQLAPTRACGSASSENIFVESGTDSDSDVSSPNATPNDRRLRRNTHKVMGGGLSAAALNAFASSKGLRQTDHNQSTHSLTAMANGATSFMGSPFGKMVVAEEGSPNFNDSMSPMVGPLTTGGGGGHRMGLGALKGFGRASPTAAGGSGGGFGSSSALMDASAMLFKQSRRMSLLPPGGKKEIKKIHQLVMDVDPLEEMLDEAERVMLRGGGACDFNKLELTAYPHEVLTPDLTSLLTELILSGNAIAELPEDAFLPMRLLKKLDLAENGLTTVPYTVLLLPQLEVLLLDHNNITHLPFQQAMSVGLAGDGRESRANSVSTSQSPLLGGMAGASSSNPSFAVASATGASFLPAPTVPSHPNTSVRPGRSSSLGGSFNANLTNSFGGASYSSVVGAVAATGGGRFKPLILPCIQRVGLAYNDMQTFPTELLHYAGPHLAELVLSSNPDLFTRSQPSLADFERCRANNKDYTLTIAVDNRPRFVSVMDREGWLSRLPWLTVEWEKIYPDKVLDFLFLGSLRTAQTPQVYEDLNIGFILTAGRDLEVHVGEGMKQLEIAVDDLPGENMIPLFEQCFAFIDEAKKAKRGVLIHCFAGLSRSVTITAAYLMKTMYPMTRDEAMILIRQSRKAAMPNRGFMENLKIYERQLREMHGDPPLTPT